MDTKKMKAAVCSLYGPPEVLKIEMLDTPIPKSDELLIRIFATSVTSGDVRVRALSGKFFLRLIMRLIFGFKRPRKAVLGTVYSGVVYHTGREVKKFIVGDEVYGLTGFNFGTYAEYIVVREQSVVTKKPFNATFDEAAAILFGGQTAIAFLKKTKIIQNSNLNVLVYGGTGSVGTSAIQIAKYYSANVTAVCSEKGKDLVLSLGADKVINYQQEDFTKHQLKYDIIFDAVGKLTRRMCKKLLNKGGKFITVGGMEYAVERNEQLEFLRELFELGNYNATIDRTYNIDEIVEAHEYVDTGRKKGNVVLRFVNN